MPTAVHVEAIMGRTGSGKSRLLSLLVRSEARLVIVDTMLEHGALAPQETLEDIYHDLRGGGIFAASCYLDELDHLEWLGRACASQRNVCLAIDEYSFWYPAPQNMPGPGILAIVRCGRKLRQRLIVTTQSPGAINKQLLSQARLWILPLAEPRERKYVLDRTGGTIDPGTIQPIETDAAGRVLVAHLVSYHDGTRTDFALDNRVPSLREIPRPVARAAPVLPQADPEPESDEIPPEAPPDAPEINGN